MTRASYWKTSKFAKWLRGTVGISSPKSVTAHGWKKWRDDYKDTHPYMYYVTEVLLNKMQNFLYKPKDLYRNASCYMHNRFISKMHYLPTNLKVGKYFDIDQRLLHGLFETLVEFVEIEKAQNAYTWGDKKKPKHKFMCMPRSREYGIYTLEWEMALREDDDETIPTNQAINAREVYDLYIWWKDIRPSRLDPMDASGYNDLTNIDSSDIFDMLALSDTPERKKARELMFEIEESYKKEDEEMMLRLIKVRKSMWT